MSLLVGMVERREHLPKREERHLPGLLNSYTVSFRGGPVAELKQKQDSASSCWPHIVDRKISIIDSEILPAFSWTLVSPDRAEIADGMRIPVTK